MVKIKNIEQLIKLKESDWNNPYAQRQFKLNTIEEFRYLLENYKDGFAFGVEYNTFEYTIYKNTEDDNVYIRNDDTFKFGDYELIVTTAYHLKDNNIDNIIRFILSQTNEERRTRIKFINIDIEDETQEIKELLYKGLIKYFYGVDYGEPNFVYLAENEKEIFKTLKNEEYSISDIIEKLECMFDGADMEIKNIWGDSISLYHGRIEELVSDDLYVYITKENQKEIFDSEIPADKVREVFNEIGRQQLRIQIDSLLSEIDRAEFK